MATPDEKKTTHDEMTASSSYYAKTLSDFGFDGYDIVQARNTTNWAAYIELLFRFSNFLPYADLLTRRDATMTKQPTGSLGDLLGVATQILDVEYFNADLVICGMDEAGVYKLGLPIVEEFSTRKISHAYLSMVPGVVSKEMHASSYFYNKISVDDTGESVLNKLYKSTGLFQNVVKYILPLYGFDSVSEVESAVKLLHGICNAVCATGRYQANETLA